MNPWHDGDVEKAELVIESKPDDTFLRGRCSICPQVRFDLSGNTLEEKQLLRAMFDIHVLRVHPPEKDSLK